MPSLCVTAVHELDNGNLIIRISVYLLREKTLHILMSKKRLAHWVMEGITLIYEQIKCQIPA